MSKPPLCEIFFIYSKKKRYSTALKTGIAYCDYELDVAETMNHAERS